MSQTATLSDFTRTSFECETEFCAFGGDLKSPSPLAAASSGLWELALTACMLVLAPLILVALAAAFVIACLRMHASDLCTEQEMVSGHQPPAPVCVPRGRLLACATSQHLWN
jgi:hypothetical protein